MELADRAGTTSFPTTTSRRFKPRLRWVLIGTTALIVSLGLVAVALLPSAEERYLDELRARGLAGRFSSDANAIAAGRQVCAALERGAGRRKENPSIRSLLIPSSQFSEGFKVLETITVEGTFSLIDSDGFYDFGAGCFGTGGYNDIQEGTPVVVKNDAGKVLVRSKLGRGEEESDSRKLSTPVRQPSYRITESPPLSRLAG